MLCGFCKGACNHVYLQNGKLQNVECSVCDGEGVLNCTTAGTVNNKDWYKDIA